MRNTVNLEGLSDNEVLKSRLANGPNTLSLREDSLLRGVIKNVVVEPMFILLLITCVIYFLVGLYREGLIMLVAIVLVSGISLIQEYRSIRSLRALNRLASPGAKVIRNGITINVLSAEVVAGDVLLLEEGEIIVADGIIEQANDFSVDESVLTGESSSVTKYAGSIDQVYRGTLVTSGTAVIKVTAVGVSSRFGKLGKSLSEIKIEKTALQRQVRSFVRNMVWVGGAAFLVVTITKFVQSHDYLKSLLRGLTMAMSILPEEIPVAFSTFLAIGAFRLTKKNVIIKHPQYAETLGTATVLCIDKTGTITENSMQIEYLFDAKSNKSIHVEDGEEIPGELLEYAMWSSETKPFDPMEKAIHALYASKAKKDLRPLYKQVHEYPISGRPPMMTHVFSSSDGVTIVAAKGATEAILRQSELSEADITLYLEQTKQYASQGLRVLAVGKASLPGPFPKTQDEFRIQFLGLIGFKDPPKKGIENVIESFYKAGISVKMITGDSSETAFSIASSVSMRHKGQILSGEQVLSMDEGKLKQAVNGTNIFARMDPEAKLKVINALKSDGEIVAMTGDGVNDAPALKSAHIGIAMGRRGSEVAKSAASLILADDDLSHMVDAIAAGRRIYDNLKKAIQYIISIHIPIILIVMAPLLLNWKYPEIFTPVHVIFLELIMGPTCSIVYEREPMELNTMLRPPRKITDTFLSSNQLGLSVLQGLLIALGSLTSGYLFLISGSEETVVRTAIFITILFSNILLTFENRSFYHSLFTTIAYKNNILYIITGITTAFIPVMMYVPFVRDLFDLSILTPRSILICLLISLACTCWIEIVKYIRRNQNKIGSNPAPKK